MGIYELKCKRCGYEWRDEVANPKTCANESCKSKYWNIPSTKISTFTVRDGVSTYTPISLVDEDEE